MKFNILELLGSFSISESFYWGKRIVKPLPQPGQYKNHAIVLNWREPQKIRIELKAGLSGRTLNAQELANYPLQLQSETFFDLAVESDEDDDKDTQKGGHAGKGGSGGRGMKARKVEDHHGLSGSFSTAHSEEIPTHARLVKGVVMGMEVARDALGDVFSLFCEQVKSAKVLASDLLASAGKTITRYTPPKGLSPRGDENKVYKYDRAKNEVMFGMAPSN